MGMKEAAVLLVVVTLLFLMLPAPAFADASREADYDARPFGEAVITLVIIGGIALIGWLIWYASETNFFPGDAGNVVFNIHGFSTSPIGGKNFSLPPISCDAINYDITWLLTDRREGRFWVASGITLRFPNNFSGYSYDNADIGWNLMMGYRNGSCDYKIYFASFTPDDAKALVWLTYRY